MKYESSKTEASFTLLSSNLQVVAISAFAQYELQIETLTKALEEAKKQIKKLTPAAAEPTEVGPVEEPSGK